MSQLRYIQHRFDKPSVLQRIVLYSLDLPHLEGIRVAAKHFDQTVHDLIEFKVINNSTFLGEPVDF